MSVFVRYEKLISSVFKSRVLLKQTGVFRGAHSFPKARYHGLRLPQLLANNVSCQNVSARLDSKRRYSEVYSEKSHSPKFQEDSHVMDNDNTAPVERPTEAFSLDVLVSLLRQENAVDICVIKIPEQIKYAQYFIVVSGVSPRHLRAMALYAIKVYKFLKKTKDPNVKIEGKDAQDWMCIDFGNIIVHFMLPETREEYELEKLWTLRSYDEQLRSIPAEKLPEDFIYDGEVTK